MNAEAEVFAVADRREVAELARWKQERDARVAEAERREAAQLPAERERQLPAGDDRVHDRARAQVVVVQDGVGVFREGVGEGVDVLGQDREPSRGPVPAEALQVARAGCEPAVQVERTRRAPRALPAVARARDEDDGSVKAFDEPRGDDPDHALVPALVGQDVPTAALLRLRPLFDLRERLAQHAVLYPLPLAVQLLQLMREPAGLVLVVGEQQVERRTGTARGVRTR